MKKKIIVTIIGFTVFATIGVVCACAPRTAYSTTPSNPGPTTSAVLSPSNTVPTSTANLAPYTTPAVSNNSETSSATIQSNIPLRVSEPADASTLTTGDVSVKGQTQPGATVSVNDTVGIADNQGNFIVPISLDDGLNAIDVIASDNNGNQGEELLLVTVDASQASSSAASGTTPPVSQNGVPLKVSSPTDGADVNASIVTVIGQTSPGATITVNDQIDTADGSGNFRIPIDLDPGPNAIDVIAIDDSGNQNEVILMVNGGSGT